MTLFQVSYILLWVLAIVLIPVSMVLLYLLAQLQVRTRAEGSGYGNNLIGRPVPLSSAKHRSSGALCDIRLFRDEIHVLLVLSPDCGTCRSLMNELTSTPSGDLADIRLLLLCMGDFERCKAAVSEIHSVPVFVQDVRDDSTMDLWHAGFPAALVVDEADIVADVRHPFSVKGVVAAVENATVKERFSVAKQGINVS